MAVLLRNSSHCAKHASKNAISMVISIGTSQVNPSKCTGTSLRTPHSHSWQYTHYKRAFPSWAHFPLRWNKAEGRVRVVRKWTEMLFLFFSLPAPLHLSVMWSLSQCQSGLFVHYMSPRIHSLNGKTPLADGFTQTCTWSTKWQYNNVISTSMASDPSKEAPHCGCIHITLIIHSHTALKHTHRYIKKRSK